MNIANNVATRTQLTTTAVSALNIRKSFGSHEVLKGVTLQVARGEVVALIGPSGSGKSTFIRCLNLLETPTSGIINHHGDEIFGPETTLNRRQLQNIRLQMGMVFQSFNLFPNLSALENISLAQIHARGRTRAESDERSRKLLDRVGLKDHANHKPGQLSGGQQQRVAIARALALDPDVMLFDEPTSAIDPELRVEVLRVMRDLADEGMTMLIVTHEMHFAQRVADTVVFFADGNIVEKGSPQKVFTSPDHDRTKKFLAAVDGEI
ncbi:MAG: amino acid ABC transporter ATP-binding protein [Gordonia sp. (in: high G+C Gram-positive bacteria)]